MTDSREDRAGGRSAGPPREGADVVVTYELERGGERDRGPWRGGWEPRTATVMGWTCVGSVAILALGLMAALALAAVGLPIGAGYRGYSVAVWFLSILCLGVAALAALVAPALAYRRARAARRGQPSPTGQRANAFAAGDVLPGGTGAAGGRAALRGD